ncbi:Glucosamine-6-phosphate isomerase (Glucosamine-6-phosphate deaminase) (GNPDA) (GlcN6P deaminase) [Blastocladiella emersonii ATCC 22665]|nr:Glucosamine-6-phosphate isomerase (Glucosamine-6-phosphate deaminase) (GNPDA) (GlcN6P deaminase) [Blastocladiella emersonii ATCC 22665]
MNLRRHQNAVGADNRDEPRLPRSTKDSAATLPSSSETFGMAALKPHPSDAPRGSAPSPNGSGQSESWLHRRLFLGPCRTSIATLLLLAAAVYAAVMTTLFINANAKLAAGLDGSTTHSGTSPTAGGAGTGTAGGANATASAGRSAPVSLWPLPRRISSPATAKLKVPLPKSVAVVLVPPTGAAAPSPLFRSTVARYVPIIFGCSDPTAIPVTVAGAGDAAAPAAGTAVLRIQVTSANEDLRLETNEKYSVDVAETAAAAGMAITVQAVTLYGAMRALDTVAQLVQPAQPGVLAQRADALFVPGETGALPAAAVAACAAAGYTVQAAPLTITDWPRVPHRGLLVDTARHFIPMATLRRIVDGIAAAKMNVFHWHISDAQSFPMRLREIPELAEKGAYSPRETYSEEDVVAFLEYCRQRGVRVIPEFDVPGHTYSFIHSYPDIIMCANRQPYNKFGAAPPTGQLDPTKDATYAVVGKILAAMARLFPDTYVHLGHDEINAECWASLNGGNTAVTLKEFHRRLRPALKASLPNRRSIVWEEPFLNQGLERDGGEDGGVFQAVQLWTKSDPDTLALVKKAGKQAIVSNANAWYLDCGHGAWTTGAPVEALGWCKKRPWGAVYDYDPFPGDTAPADGPSWSAPALPVAKDAVIGGEVCMWTEQADAGNVMQRIFPRAVAFAERAWSHPGVDPGTDGNRWVDVTERLHDARERLLSWRGVPSAPLQPTWCRGRAGECVSGE